MAWGVFFSSSICSNRSFKQASMHFEHGFSLPPEHNVQLRLVPLYCPQTLANAVMAKDIP